MYNQIQKTAKKQKAKRLRLPDLLKGIAIFFMIQVHIMELFIDYPGRSSVVGKLSLFIGGPFTAMVFMLVMGYFVAGSKKSLHKNLLRGFKIFVLGFLLNIGLNLHLLLKIKFAAWPYNPLEYIFGVDILYLAGLSIVILALLKLIPQKLQIPISFALLTIVLLLTPIINERLTLSERNYIVPFIGGNYSWSYFPLFPWLTYPLAGYFFFFAEAGFQKFISERKRSFYISLMVAGAFVIYLGKMGFATTIDLPTYYHHNIKYGLWALAVLVIWIALFGGYIKHFRPNSVENLLGWMGKNITLIYVLQWLIIGNLATAIYQTQPLSRFPLLLGIILSATLLLSWLLTSKTKLV